jgi:hypothetical protein
MDARNHERNAGTPFGIAGIFLRRDRAAGAHLRMANRKADAAVDGVNRARRGLGGSDEWFTPLQ